MHQRRAREKHFGEDIALALLDVAAGYARPDLDQLEQRAAALSERLIGAQSPAAAIDTVLEWNALRVHTATDRVRAQVGFLAHTNDAAAALEKRFWDENEGRLRLLDVGHARAVLDCRFSDAVAQRFGSQFLALKRCVLQTASPALGRGPAEESQLVASHWAATSLAEIDLQGERLTASQLRKHFASSEREVRRRAFIAFDDYLGAKAELLQTLMGQLISVRDAMGVALGCPDFVPLAFQRMERIGYDRAECEQFRETVARSVVPLCAQLRARQAERLGLDRLLIYDEWALDAGLSLSPGCGDDFVLDTAQTIASQLHPEAGDLFERMRDLGTLDVQARSGKVGGALSTYLPELEVPYVFAHFTGCKRDVDSLLHEFGHAFQMHLARRLPLLEYLCPTAEGSEFCAAGMQALLEPELCRFFDVSQTLVRRTQTEEGLLAIPLLLLLDHFQQELYEHPRLSASERNQLWLRLERRYMPWRDYGDELPQLGRGAYWQSIQHLFSFPFYALDYVFARLGGWQLRERAERDPKRTVEEYVSMCRLGGSVSFKELFASGGLGSPFEPETIAETLGFVWERIESNACDSA